MNPQTSFRGGMNLLDDETRIRDDQYVYMFNGRNRFDNIQPIKNPRKLDLSSIPSGPPTLKRQGLYSAGSYLILFAGGRFFFKRLTAVQWVEIYTTGSAASPPLDPQVDTIYAELVPASSSHFHRKLAPTSNPNDPLIVSTALVSGTPGALVVQDGINQPWIIFADGTSRMAKTWTEWNNTISGNREYVPKGKQMKYFDDILFIVSPDGDQIYRSLTRRPLDFMVQIDLDGNKGQSEALAGASSTSHAVSFDPITCIAPFTSDSPATLIIGTDNASYALVIDRNNLIFGEPTLRSRALFPYGIINQFSYLDTGGDFNFTDSRGLRSVNAVQQLRNEGNNSIFSRKVSPLFKEILQDPNFSCSVIYDNFALFSVNTIYGYIVLVYDLLNIDVDEKTNKVYQGSFVGIDQTSASKIKQFAKLEPYTTSLFALINNDIYELFASTDINPFATCTLKPKVQCSNNPKIELIPNALRGVFSNNVLTGNVTVTPYVNGKKCLSQTQALPLTQSGIQYPALYPVSFVGEGSINNKVFPLKPSTFNGWKVGTIIQWNNGAYLTHLLLDVDQTTMQKSMQEKAKE